MSKISQMGSKPRSPFHQQNLASNAQVMAIGWDRGTARWLNPTDVWRFDDETTKVWIQPVNSQKLDAMKKHRNTV
jgi:hypothetical protein